MEQNQKPIKKLYRSQKDKVIFGVCGGLGEYFNIDPIIFRIIFLALTLGAGSGILLYLILAIVMPKESSSADGDRHLDGEEIKKRAKDLADEAKEHGFNNSARAWLGLAIIIIGSGLLLNQIFPRRFFNWGIFWAVLIIGFGIFIITRGGEGRNSKKKAEKIENPAMLSSKEEKKQAKRQRRLEKRVNRGGGIGRFFFGLVFLIIGFAVLAVNFGWIDNINLHNLWQLWPILIILAGASMLSRATWFGSFLAVIVSLAVIILIIIFLFLPITADETKIYDFQIPRDLSASTTELLIQSGASEVKISGGESLNLAKGFLKSNLTELKTESKIENGVQKAKITMEGNMKKILGSFTNSLEVNLSENLPISLKVESGASKLNLDLTNIQLSDLAIHAGASSIDLILGDKITGVISGAIDAGVSSINISLPKNIGARIEVKSALSAKELVDFEKLTDNIYQSANYQTTEKKINLVFKAGLSGISVVWR